MKPLKQAVYSSRTADKFVVRLPDGVREVVAGLARGQHRSMNSYIILAVENQVRLDAVEKPDVPLPEQQWMPAEGEMIWLNKGRYSKGPILVTVEAKYAVYQPDFIPSLSDNAKPEVVLDTYFMRWHENDLVKVDINGVPLECASPAQL